MEAQLAATPGTNRAGLRARYAVTGDERLARMIAEGSDSAFEALYARYHQPLYRLCRSVVGNDSDAQDALQSAFTGALVALRQGRRDAPLRPWLYRIAHNESISLLRRRRPEVELPEELSAVGRSAHEVAEERARLAMLVSDLRELPDQQRGALVMRELGGLPHEEIAAALGITVGAAKQTVLEARRSLAEFSEGRSMSCHEIQRWVSDGDRRMLRGRRVRAHLRSCAGCRNFSEAIPQRRADLLALSPALPALAASGVLARITGGAAHAHSGGGGAGLAAGAAGKGLGTAMSLKALAAGVAVVATAAAGTAGVVHLESTAAPTSVPALAPRVPAAHSSHQGTTAGRTAAGHRASGAGTVGRSSKAGALHGAHHRASGIHGGIAGSRSSAAASGQGAAGSGHGAAAGHGAGTAHGLGTADQGTGASQGGGVAGSGSSHRTSRSSSHGAGANATRSRSHSTTTTHAGSSQAGASHTSASPSRAGNGSGASSSGTGSSSRTTPTTIVPGTSALGTTTNGRGTTGQAGLGATIPTANTTSP